MRSMSEEKSPPNAKRMIAALRQIGYSLEQAIADLIDNSIDAEAKNVMIRFLTEGENIASVIIADDGRGMGSKKLADAMQFGSDDEAETEALGKYGMGLKIASLSHARSLTVVTRSSRKTIARRWTIKGIEKGWLCDILDENEADDIYGTSSFGFDNNKSGTLVIWDDIDKLPVSKKGLAVTLRSIKKKLNIYMGLYFHRFIEDGRLNIFIDVQEMEQEAHGIKDTVTALNPFGYRIPGDSNFPKQYMADVEGVGNLKLSAHIWPANSDLPNYKLGGKTSSKQGFYFYRNDRLIQAGGWNGVVEDETEPHGSLARVVVDLPEKYDGDFGLNVQKSAVIVPPSFVGGVKSSRSDDNHTFKHFRSSANKAYRKKDKGAQKYIPVVPGSGIPGGLEKKARNYLVKERGKTRAFDFEWTDFESGDLFALDQENRKILLNNAFRRKLLRGKSKSQSDLPLFKLLIFLLAKEDIDKIRMSSKRKEELEGINKILVEAAKLEKG
jgi:hypothetical protein